MVERGRFPLYDVHLNMREGTEIIRNTLTLVNGRPLPAKVPEPPAPWVELTERQREFDAALRRRPSTPPAYTSKNRNASEKRYQPSGKKEQERRVQRSNAKARRTESHQSQCG